VLEVPAEPVTHSDFDCLACLSIFFLLVRPENDDGAGFLVDVKVDSEVDPTQNTALVTKLVVAFDATHIDSRWVAWVCFSGQLSYLLNNVFVLGRV
jgi:hypothetical protein